MRPGERNTFAEVPDCAAGCYAAEIDRRKFGEGLTECEWFTSIVIPARELPCRHKGAGAQPATRRDRRGRSFSISMPKDSTRCSRRIAGGTTTTRGVTPSAWKSTLSACGPQTLWSYNFPVWCFGMPAMLKGFLDHMFMPGVGFDISDRARVRPMLGNIKRIAGIPTYGRSWLMVLAMGDPPRKIVTRDLRWFADRRARVDY